MIETYDIKRSFWSQSRLLVISLGIAIAFVIAVFWWSARPPADFPINSPVTVSRGLSAAGIAGLLEESGVVRSELLLYMIIMWRYDPNALQAGTFVFDRPLSVNEVANRLATTPGAASLVVVTLPEGYTVAEFASLAASALPDFDSEEFIALGKDNEGYLFPDTYYVPADFTATELYELLRATYVEKTAELQSEMAEHSLGEYGVLTLASLLEREANSEESMQVVSGILLKRLDEGMRLQIDASLEYVLDRPLHTLKPEDLEIDSPYNTYLYGGLPPTPIGNPGLQAIRAVLYPMETEYYYYLTDENGTFHYAETFDEHRDNIAKYLQ